MMHLPHISRRTLLTTGAAAAVSLAIHAPVFADTPASPGGAPDDSLRRLLEGNSRFAKGEIIHPGRKPADFQPLAKGQNPIAAIVACADSRVPPEILFDQGIGDLFVIRIAGNYVSGAGASVKGSIEYAVAELGVSLIMVLGHSQCGAVKAAIKHIHDHDALPGAINDLVACIKPAVTAAESKPGDLLDNAIKANVQIGVDKLATLEPVLASRVKAGQLKIVGAVYDLHSGQSNLVS